MAKDTNKTPVKEKLVENDVLSIRDMPLKKKSLTKKQLRREVVPHIRHHKVNDSLYYYYIDGARPEIYLGSADFILKAVTICRGRKG